MKEVGLNMEYAECREVKESFGKKRTKRKIKA